MGYAIGVDLGGTRIKAVAVSETGEILERVMRRTGDETGEAWWGYVKEIVEELESGQGAKASWIGVGAPGIARPDGRCIGWMQGRLDVLEGLEWTEVLGRTRQIPVINDGQAALMGEVWVGAAKGCENVVMLTLGTGVGGAVICDGRLLKGAIGRAGHLGHLSVDMNGAVDFVKTPGSVEWFIGNHSIGERSKGKFVSTYELLEAYRAGDKEAKRIWLQSIKALGAGVVSIANALDPEIVLLGGGIAEANDDLFGPLKDVMDEMEWRPHGHQVKILKAEGGEFTGAMGAGYNAMRFDG